MLVRSVLIFPAELAFSCRWVRSSSDARSLFTCLQVAWLATSDCECDDGLCVAGADVPPFAPPLPLELQAAITTAALTARTAMADWTGPCHLTCDCVAMRSCSPADAS